MTLVTSMLSVGNWAYCHEEKKKSCGSDFTVDDCQHSLPPVSGITLEKGATSCSWSLATQQPSLPLWGMKRREEETSAEKSDLNIASAAVGCVFSLSNWYSGPLAPFLFWKWAPGGDRGAGGSSWYCASCCTTSEDYQLMSWIREPFPFTFTSSCHCWREVVRGEKNPWIACGVFILQLKL